MKNEPIRTCVICRGRSPKRDLDRHVCPPPGGATAGTRPAGLVPDPGQRLPGRGFYVCANQDCKTAFDRYQGWRTKCKGVRV